MADNNRNPQQQQNDPARQAPSQQQQQGQPRQDEQGRIPAARLIKAIRPDAATGPIRSDETTPSGATAEQTVMNRRFRFLAELSLVGEGPATDSPA
jgi:hypothetical protein